MDLLGEVLLSLKVASNSGGIYALGKDWGLAVPKMPSAYAYAFCCIDTPFWILRDTPPPLELQPGDSILVLHGAKFRIASSVDADCVELFDYWEEHELPKLLPGAKQTAPIAGLKLGDEPRQGRLLSLAFLLQDAGGNALLSALPDVILLRGSARGFFPWIGSMLEFLANEQTSATPGYVATATHLAELIFTSFIRAHALSLPSDSVGWLRGIADKRIRHALALIHSNAGFPWTTEALAGEAGMSRHTFGRRFAKLVGQSPIEYLIDCRMQLAAEKVMEGRLSIAQIAEVVGYESERAFREVFKKRFGLPPLRYAKVQAQLQRDAARH
ncbi:hypothetical protein CIC12_20240 [Burkholderia sp. SG-MS1]|uniref:AraC family transcriptional regulator n=1 Tax=Paraburkholderia sp. SG-MS1 TaxID=2023741 RepID=UPI001445E849|nr:AraC family transcriptional regulator [Paraburkholderia sp. SG-MS1]NKJ49022.1 hypothetical protein [Paraburkholderia sp. SG-MS1]